MMDSHAWLTRSVIARSMGLAAAFLAPVAIGVGVHHPLTGLLVGIGGFMVANADLGESYTQRLRLMVPATVAIAGMMAAGMAAGASEPRTVLVGAAVFLLSGLAASLGREAALFGTFVAFAYVIGTGLAAAPELSISSVVWPILVGGALALALSAVNAGVFPHPADEPPEPWRTLPRRAKQRLDRELIRHVLALTIAGGIALAIVPATHQSNGAWLVTGALIVLKPGYHDTVRTALVRAGGTVVGAATAAAVAASIGERWALIFAAFLLTWTAEVVIGRSFAAFVVLITPLSILLTNVLVPGDWRVAYLRVADVACGSAVAIIVASILHLAFPDSRASSPAAMPNDPLRTQA
jgi:hypothetical protein